MEPGLLDQAAFQEAPGSPLTARWRWRPCMPLTGFVSPQRLFGLLSKGNHLRLWRFGHEGFCVVFLPLRCHDVHPLWRLGEIQEL